MGLHGQDILDILAELKVSLMQRYEEWQKNPYSAQLQSVIRQQAELAKREVEVKKREFAMEYAEQEARRKELETRRKEAELLLKEEEVQRKEQELLRIEEDARRMKLEMRWREEQFLEIGRDTQVNNLQNTAITVQDQEELRSVSHVATSETSSEVSSVYTIRSVNSYKERLQSGYFRRHVK